MFKKTHQVAQEFCSAGTVEDTVSDGQRELERGCHGDLVLAHRSLLLGGTDSEDRCLGR